MNRYLNISHIAFIVYLLAWGVFYAVVLLAAIFLAWGCSSVPGDPFAIHRPSEVHAVCLMLEDADGHTYRRTAWFNDAGYRRALEWPGSAPGMCE
jgi:hypothetical protein